MFFSKMLLKLRQKENLTIEDFAQKIKCNVEDVKSWELGITLPDDNKIKELSSILHISFFKLNNSIKEQIMFSDEKSLNLVWTYKKYSIISCVLLLLVPVFLCMLVMGYENTLIKEILNYVVGISIIILIFISLSLQFFQNIKIKNASRSKVYKVNYTSNLLLYGIIYCFLLVLIILFIPIIIYA